MSKAAELAALIGSQTALSNRNLIINGAQLVDQRNGGSSVTINGTNETYVTDRFICRGESSDGVFTAEQDTTTPDDFKNSLKIAVTTADSSIGATQSYLIRHKIEGQNVTHLNWGSSSARKCTLSFSVRSSVTGTFGGSFNNSAFDRSYPFTYTISAADTWERKEITVDGPTDGTWLTTNGAGIIIGWSLGAGSSRIGTADAWASANYQGATGQTNLIATNSSTLYITGIQLEVGEQATPFEHRSFGDELLRCQRYFVNYPDTSTGTNLVFMGRGNGSTQAVNVNVPMPVVMRATPTFSQIASLNAIGPSGYNNASNVTPTVTGTPTFEPNLSTSFTGLSGLTDNRLAGVYIFSPFSISAEL